VVDIEVQDERAARPQQAPGLRDGGLRIVDVVEAVAHQDDVRGPGQERDRLGPRGEVDGVGGEEQAGFGEPLGERLDADADHGRTGVGKAERAGPDVDHDLVVEERGVRDPRLVEDPAHLGARLLPAPPLVARRGLLTREEREDIVRQEAALGEDRVPLPQPPRQLLVTFDLGLRT
jgi:hypothetical protein